MGAIYTKYRVVVFLFCHSNMKLLLFCLFFVVCLAQQQPFQWSATEQAAIKEHGRYTNQWRKGWKSYLKAGESAYSAKHRIRARRRCVRHCRAIARFQLSQKVPLTLQRRCSAHNQVTLALCKKRATDAGKMFPKYYPKDKVRQKKQKCRERARARNNLKWCRRWLANEECHKYKNNRFTTCAQYSNDASENARHAAARARIRKLRRAMRLALLAARKKAAAAQEAAGQDVTVQENAEEKGQWFEHRIQPGDSLSKYFQRGECRWGTLKEWNAVAAHNGLTDINHIVAGEWIKLPQRLYDGVSAADGPNPSYYDCVDPRAK